VSAIRILSQPEAKESATNVGDLSSHEPLALTLNSPGGPNDSKSQQKMLDKRGHKK
jgi:hypothetical protein